MWIEGGRSLEGGRDVRNFLAESKPLLRLAKKATLLGSLGANLMPVLKV